MQDLNVSLMQTELFWENKTQNLAHFSALINSIIEQTDIIVLPEMFTTGFSMQPELFAETMSSETVKWMLHTAKEKDAVLTGSVIIKEGEKYYNRLIWAQPNGETFYYDKRHLFTLSSEEQHYSAGKEKLMVKYKGWKICPLICYDLRFPVWCRNSRQTTGHRSQLQNGVYDLLLFVANWPEKRSAAWKTLLQARAIENQAYAIGVNRIGNDGNNIYHSGNSSVIDPMGDVVFSQSDLPFVKTFTLSKERLLFVREKLPFLNDADNYSINI
jgi:predicted amidohydrolase